MLKLRVPVNLKLLTVRGLIDIGVAQGHVLNLIGKADLVSDQQVRRAEPAGCSKRVMR